MAPGAGFEPTRRLRVTGLATLLRTRLGHPGKATSALEVDAFPTRRLLAPSSIPLSASANRPAYRCYLPVLTEFDR